MGEFRYKAFLSYSHEDRAWAEQIHRALESYRVPRRLRGVVGEHGPVGARIRPVFMDREDLGAAHSLDHELRVALEASEFLVVLCSPAAARSRWIDEEIRLFAELGRWHKVLAVIIDGDPEARGGPETCFPEALYRDPQGHEHEPLASDMRPGADGKPLGLQKLIAGLLGVPLDLLRRREHQRTVRRRLLAGAVCVALAAAGLFSLFSWMESGQRRDSGETLVAMKLNELRTVLDVTEDPERLPRLASFEEADRQWAREQLAQGADEAEQMALDLVDLEGIPAWETGDLAVALEHFRRAWLLNALLFQASPGDSEAFFALGQTEFWIGQVQFDQGEFAAAKRAFTAYAEITRRLIRSEPDNPEWVLEMAYALTNLGYLEIQGNGNPDKVLQIMQSALEYNQIALVLDPGNPLYEGELGQSLANLASAQVEVCDLDGALATTETSVAHELAIQEQQNGGVDHHWNLAAALGKRAAIQSVMGKADQSTRDLAHSLGLLEALHAAQPEDLEVEMLIHDRRARLLRERGMAGVSPGEMREIIDAFAQELARWQALLDSLDDPGLRFHGDLVSSRLSRAEILILADRHAEALAEIRQAQRQAMEIRRQSPESSPLGDQLGKAAFLAWHLNEATDGVAAEPVGDLPGSGRSCVDALTGLRLSLLQGESGMAADYARFLGRRGFADSSYEFICSHYSVCETR